MDSSFLAAIIGAFATIISAIIGPMIQWGLQIGANQNQRCWFRAVVIFQIISVLFLVAGSYLIYSNYLSSEDIKSFAPNLSPALISYDIGENFLARIIHPVSQKPDLPKDLNWYELKSNNLIISKSLPLINHPINSYLSYESHVDKFKWGWTGFSISRTFPLSPWDFVGKSKLTLIIFAENPAKLEIGIKDKYGRADKPSLEIKKGWAGYKIPFSEFPQLDFNKIETIQIAHAFHLNRTYEASNLFKIAIFSID